MQQVADIIRKIGNDMVRCTKRCEGVRCEPENGVLPRCLYFQAKEPTEGRGCAIVVINPGRSRDREHQFFRTNGPTYDNVVAGMQRAISRIPFYRRLRNLADQLHLTGPILWTELAKCESIGGGLPPLQTFRTCTKEYLSQELQAIPQDWPLIAVGGEVYKALAYRYPDSTLIGVPHPVAARGHFRWLFEEQWQLREEFKDQALDLLNHRPGECIWLHAENVKKKTETDNST